MNWLNRAEAKFGHLAIAGLPQIIVGFNVLVYVLYKIDRSFLTWLNFDRHLILHEGQIWRLVSYIFIPGFSLQPFELLTVVLYLLGILYIGAGLEHAMGPFRLTVYYLLGIVGLTSAGLFFGGRGGGAMLNSTLFFAYAFFYPEAYIYVMYILPMKVKWVAWGSAAMLLLTFVDSRWNTRAGMLFSFLNYFVFFGGGLVREARNRGKAAGRRQRFLSQIREAQAETLHHCTICGRTEVSDPYLDFRVTAEGVEYCADHLPTANSPAPPPSPAAPPEIKP